MSLLQDVENDYGMPVHPVCDLFPLMDGNDLSLLENDIEENGLINPLVIHQGALVDGRNRLLACRGANVKPRYVEWRAIYHGPQPLARWIWSVNAERRHLTIDQYTAAQVALHAWEETEAAKQRQVEAGKRGAEGGRSKTKTLQTDSSQGFTEKPQRQPQVRTKLAKELGVSEHKVQQALNVQKANPELLKDVAKGKVKTLREAGKRIKPQTQTISSPRVFRLDVVMKPLLTAIEKRLRTLSITDRQLLLTAFIKKLEEFRK